MKIYGDLASGNCLKVKYLADHLRPAYDWVPVDVMSGESRSADFLAMNPMGQVPTVAFDDGRVLAQSNAILLYLAEGSALLPADRYARAKVSELLFWEQYSHEPYVAVCRFQMVYLGKPRDAREPWRVARGEQALDLMETLLSGRDWLVGDGLTVADIALLPYTRLAHEGGFDLVSRRAVRAWISRCEAALGLEAI
jgi:glutathione S-transferase